MHTWIAAHRPIARSIAALALVLGACAAPTDTTPPATNPAPTASTAAASATPASTPTATPATPGPTVSPINPARYVEGAPYAPRIDPADFVTVIDNPYLSWIPGTEWTYAGGGERIVVTVLPETRVILGVTVTVVHDRVFADGELAEDTFDWYAQDRAGNVWYFGERTEELEAGRVTSTAGSWEAGVGGAQPGIVMLARPLLGEAYRQEFYAGEAEDVAKVIEPPASVTVRAGTFDDLVVTEDWTPLEPGTREHKTYARGVGLVLERLVKGGHERVGLVSVEGP